MSEKPIRVLIVDDSAVVRGVLSRILSREPGIEVVGSAADAYEAREKIVELQPDVVTLDIKMPRMDGLTFLGNLMRHFPLPVVIVSGLTRENADLSLRALELGAVDVVSKPGGEFEGLREVSIELIDKIQAAARVRFRRRRLRAGAADGQGHPLTATLAGQIRAVGRIGRPARPSRGVRPRILPAPPELARNGRKVVAIGASTGGTEALRVALERLPRETPGIVIVQHMPEHFTRTFAERLNALCEIEVKEAESGDAVRPGLALIAPGNSHLMVRKKGTNLVADVRDGPLVCRHRPSVEVLFQSVAKAAGPHSVGVILTGMGSDGSCGMAAMKEAGALNIAQDEASCVVFGMPKEAIQCGGVDRVVRLDRIPKAILEFCCR